MKFLRSGLLKALFLSSAACVSGCANIYPLSAYPQNPDINKIMHTKSAAEVELSPDLYPRSAQPYQASGEPARPAYDEYGNGPNGQARNPSREAQRDLQYQIEMARRDQRERDCQKNGGVYQYRQDRCELPRRTR